MSEQEGQPQAFEGVGRTLHEALDDAATNAVAGGVELESILDVAQHSVRISNPRVTEHIVVLITKP